MARKTKVWEPCVWPGCTNPEILSQFDCYRYKTHTGYIYLEVYHEVYEGPRSNEAYDGRNTVKYYYTSSMGANSDESFSGILLPCYNSSSLEEAQKLVVRKVYLQNDWLGIPYSLMLKVLNPYPVLPESIAFEEHVKKTDRSGNYYAELGLLYGSLVESQRKSQEAFFAETDEYWRNAGL